LRERNLILGLFGVYVPETVAKQLIDQQGQIVPQSTSVTTLFTDIAGFTTLSEGMDPKAVIAMLNEYFSLLTTLIEQRGGTVTQFQGDGLLAAFNVPASDSHHATNAVAAAIDIRDQVRSRTFAGMPLACRIGVATGNAVAGSVGAEGRLSYTVYGDSVNLAARLEQMNKDFGTVILIAEDTVAQASEFDYRRIGEKQVRGRVSPVTLYTING